MAHPARATGAECAARLPGRTARRARGFLRPRPSRACPRSRDRASRRWRTSAGAARRPRGGGLRRSSRASDRLPSNASSRFLAPERRERHSQLLDRAKHAVLRRAGPETERPADLLDRSSFVMAQRERRALERAERAERLAHALLNLGALGQPLGSWRLVRRHLDRFVETLAPR